MRLDRFLASLEELGSRGEAERLLSERGAVTVDGERRPKSYRVQEGEEVAFEVPEREVVAEAAVEQAAPLRIPYQDEHLLVVDKPAGLVVHPGAGHAAGTLADALVGHGAAGGEEGRLGIVHRLDRDTSGLLAVARSDEAFERLQELVRERALEREYLALVRGKPRSRSGRIEAPIGRDRRDATRQSLDTDTPRDAVTHFELEERLQRHALLRVRLETGRMHQIRVHLAAINLPVAGDSVYGVGGELGLDRQFLHAARLAFDHPITGERVEATSPLAAGPRRGARPRSLARRLRALRLVQPLVGEAEERVRRDGVVRIRRETGAEREPFGQPTRRRLLVDQVVQAREEPAARLEVALDQADRELVPAQTTGEVGPAERLGEQRGHATEHAVALGVAELVVDRLERVDVDVDEREAALVAARTVELLLDADAEGRMVEELGERVPPRLVGELRRGAVEVGDDALGDEHVEAVVQSPLRLEDLAAREVVGARGDEAPEHPPQDEQLGDDLPRREAERLPLPRVVPDQPGQRPAAPHAPRLGLCELLRELDDEGRHVPELADLPEPLERGDGVLAQALVDDLDGQVPGGGPDLLRQGAERLRHVRHGARIRPIRAAPATMAAPLLRPGRVTRVAVPGRRIPRFQPSLPEL